MGSHETTAAACPLPGTAQPLSWRLGERLVGDGTDVALELQRDGGRASVTVYEATAHTAVVAVRTPVGRRRYYEVPADGVERAVDRAVRTDDWQVADSPA